MKRNETFFDYAQALKGTSPAGREKILLRAVSDFNISLNDLSVLQAMADELAAVETEGA